jgi:hypothetical protein
MSRGKELFVVTMLVSIASICGAVNCHAQATKPCQAIKQYLGSVEQASIYAFGEEREKKLIEAQTAFREQLAKLNYSLSDEMAGLIKRYVGLTSWGHDRMRKGDASLLVKARDAHRRIKELCPWD